MPRKPSSFYRSLTHATRGLLLLFKTERNAQRHLAAAIVVVLAGFYFAISPTEWSIICLTIGAVLMAEGFNTALEKLADFITTETHPEIGKVKDVAAGAVLLISVAALAIGAIIFVPHLVDLFS